MPKYAVIIPAAGKSTRFRDREKKPYATLDGRAVWLRSVELFVTRDDVAQVILVINPDDQEMFRRRYTANIAFMNVQLALGGAERFESVDNALALVKSEIDFIAIHDAARPCVTEEQINLVFSEAALNGAAILAAPIHDTIKRADSQRRILATEPRQGLWLAQTPQVFRRDWLLAAYAGRTKLADQRTDITDDAQLVEAAGHPVHVVESSSLNVKITTKNDLFLAEAVLKSRPKPKEKRPIHPFADEEMWK